MEYTIASGGSEFRDDLIASVNELLKTGWRPVGGVTVVENNFLIQAMTRVSTAASAEGGSLRKKSTQQIRKTRHRRK